MPKLKVMSAKEVIRIFEDFGFEVVGQKGSHIKLRRILNNNIRQILTIPNHKEIDKGTLKAIYNQASKYVSETELIKYFYIKKA